MFEFLKVKKIKNELDLILSEKTFDYEKSEKFQLEKDSPELFYDNYCFSAHSVDKKQSLYIKLKTNSVQSEVWMNYCEGYNKYHLEQLIYTSNCPLKIIKEEDGISISFAGYLKKNNKDLVRITFSGKFTTDQKPINYESKINSKSLSKRLSYDKNFSSTLEKIKNNKYNYYEQLGSIKGKIIVEGQHSHYEMPCLKTHSYGYLDWTQINNHLSLNVIDKDTLLTFQMVSVPNIPILEVGNYYKKNKDNIIMENAVYERQMLVRKSSPEYLNILMNLINEDNKGIHVKKVDEFKYTIQESYDVIISATEVLINGKTYRGILEFGFNKDQTKWFDGKDIGELKW